MKQRIYIDTSVIGGCIDKEFSLWSNKLFNEFKMGLRIAVISDLTLKEIEKAPEKVKKILTLIPKDNVEKVFLSEEAEKLAKEYVNKGIVNVRDIIDAQHIALATVERTDILVSWNFQQIVNLNKIRGFNSINLRLGYPIIEIRSPREVVYE